MEQTLNIIGIHEEYREYRNFWQNMPRIRITHKL